MCEATMANNVWVLCMGKICPWKIPGTSIRSLKILASHSAIPWQSRFRQPVWNFGLPSGNRTKRSNQRWPTVAHTVVVHEQSSVQPEFSRTWETTSHVCQGGQVAAGDQNGNDRFYLIFHHITIRYIKNPSFSGETMVIDGSNVSLPQSNSQLVLWGWDPSKSQGCEIVNMLLVSRNFRDCKALNSSAHLIMQGLKLDHMYSFVTWHS